MVLTSKLKRTILIVSFSIFSQVVDGFGLITNARLGELQRLTRSSIAEQNYSRNKNPFRKIVTSRRYTSDDKDLSEDVSTAIDSKVAEGILTNFNKYHADEEITYTESYLLRFEMDKFKPLGCTAEESLNVSSDGSKHVFISKVTEGGNAEKAGLKTGDVIVAVSGSFEANNVTPVVGASLERVKSLIGGREEGKGLVIMVIRNSDVMSKHETTLVDICVLPDNDAEVDKCIQSMYQADYDIKKYDVNADVEAPCDDGDTDCMLDAMFDVWSDELGLKKGEEAAEEVKEVKKKPAPWSSRSSPSGTYVR